MKKRGLIIGPVLHVARSNGVACVMPVKFDTSDALQRMILDVTDVKWRSAVDETGILQ